jgi:hypothetical protein
MRASIFLLLTILAPLPCAATEPIEVWMTDCQPELLGQRNASKTKMTLCGLEGANGRCKASSHVLLLGSAPSASISSLALTLGAGIKSVRLIRFVSDTAAFVYSPDSLGPPIRLYVLEDKGLWHLHYSCDMPVPTVFP